MQVGNLRHRITFQRKSTSKDSAGQDVHTWVDFSPTVIRSASIKPLKGSELNEARSIQSQVLTSIMVRYDPETAQVGHEHQIIEHEESPNTVYAIHAVIPRRDQGYRWLEFWCSEGLQDFIVAAVADTFTVLDSDGNSFSPSFTVLDADGNSFTVTNAVLDSDGNSFTVT